MRRVHNALTDQSLREMTDDLLMRTGYIPMNNPYAADLVMLDDNAGTGAVHSFLDHSNLEDGLDSVNLLMAQGLWQVVQGVMHIKRNGYHGKICVFTCTKLAPDFVQGQLAKIGVDYVIDKPVNFARFIRDEMPAMFYDYAGKH